MKFTLEIRCRHWHVSTGSRSMRLTVNAGTEVECTFYALDVPADTARLMKAWAENGAVEVIQDPPENLADGFVLPPEPVPVKTATSYVPPTGETSF